MDPPTYGAKIQYAIEHVTSPELCPKEKTIIQKVVGCILYYALEIDATMLVALSNIASEQANPTAVISRTVAWLLDYAASHPDAKIRYAQNNMKLWAHSDASYLSVVGAKSRAGAVFFLGQKWPTPLNHLYSAPS